MGGRVYVAMMPRFLRQVDTVFVQAIDSTFALDPDEGLDWFIRFLQIG